MAGGWERLASHEGGTVVALATVPMNRGGSALFAATAAGLFHSGDGGREWAASGDTPLPLIAAIAPSARFAENGMLFAGTQTGFHRSTDTGRTWRRTLAGGRVFAIAVVPGDGGEDRIFVGTDADGILRSDDGGLTWAGANPGLLDLTVLALAFSPDTARDLTGFAATASGLYRTRNGGKSWRAVELPLDEPVVQCLAISPLFPRDRFLLAGTEGDGLWRSDDGGGTWDLVAGLPAGRIDALAFSPRDAAPRLVAAATENGVALSRDGGESWRLTGAALPPVLDLAFIPDGAGETLVAGLYRDGVARLALIGEGDRWAPANAGLRATFLSTLVASPSFSRDRLLVAAGPDAGLRVSRDSGLTWGDAGLTDAVVNGVTIAPAGGGQLLVAATNAGVYRSRDDGASWERPAPGAESPAGIVVAATAADGGQASLYAATLDGRLIMSENGGAAWRALDTPFDGTTILSLACAPDRTLYAGTTRRETDAVTVWRSADGGRSWACWLEEGGGARTLPLAAPSAPDGGLFVALGGRVMQPRRNAWQTRGGARSPLWSGAEPIADGGELAAITALAVSPGYRADGTVFTATSAGVYRSRTRGRTFDRWSEGLAPAPVLALAATTASHDAMGVAPVLVFALDVGGTIWRRVSDADR